ncbi:hypothetical protein BVRB_4g082250 [Beta vulgaris subsp. vulgaris]|nr:hypothetical protein BVRB_4g082250 [Beta vulgaris subsp. vulgaris]
MELELPRLLAPDLLSNGSSLRDLDCTHSNYQTQRAWYDAINSIIYTVFYAIYDFTYTFYLVVRQGIAPLMSNVICGMHDRRMEHSSFEFTVLPPVYLSTHCGNVKNRSVHSQPLKSACDADLAKITVKERVLMALHISCTQ